MIRLKTNGYSLLHISLFGIGLILLILFLGGCQKTEANLTPTLFQGEFVATNTSSPTSSPTKISAPTLTLTLETIATDTQIQTPSATPRPTLALGATKISAVDGMVLVYIPAGEFLMGSTDAAPGADYDELPQHAVYLDAYWIDQIVITNERYAAFLNEMGSEIEARATWLDAGGEGILLYQQAGVWQPFQGYGDYPVVEVTWYGAWAYCEWACGHLPTEAEWEKAARSTDSRLYPWGDEIDCDHAQYANCGGGLLPANSKPAGASPYGVLGLAGNVWEWVADWYADDYYAASPAENPDGPSTGSTRVLRGGSWEYDRKHLRAANRRHNGPAVSMHDYGFRCVFADEQR